MSDFEVHSGDTKRVRIPVFDTTGAEVNLTLADEITFQASEWRGGPVVLEKLKSTGGITTYTPAGAGVANGMQVNIEEGDLVGSDGEYYYIARVHMSEGSVLDTVKDGNFYLYDVPTT